MICTGRPLGASNLTVSPACPYRVWRRATAAHPPVQLVLDRRNWSFPKRTARRRSELTRLELANHSYTGRQTGNGQGNWRCWGSRRFRRFSSALTEAGCKKIFSDKLSGRRAERPGPTQAQEAQREGDTLVAWKLDRLGRNIKNLVNLVGELHQHGVQFKSLTDAIDTATPSGRFVFHVMASLA